MYRLTVDGTVLHNNDYGNSIVDKPVLKMSANKLSTLTFTIYNTNPCYGRINKMSSIIKVYRDNEIIAMVRPVKSKLNFLGGIDYTCEDCLARLNDIKYRPEYFSGTQADYIDHLLQSFMEQYEAAFNPEHLGSRSFKRPTNALVVRELQAALTKLGYGDLLGPEGTDGQYGILTENAMKQFEHDNGLTVNGNFDVNEDWPVMQRLINLIPIEPVDITFECGETPHSGEDSIRFYNTEYLGFWDVLQKQIVEQYGGYLIPRYADNTITLDYMGDEDLNFSEQKIEFGENLTDLFIETDTNDVFSVIIPLGPDTSMQFPYKGRLTVPINIKQENGGIDYLENKNAIELYGRREKTVRWLDDTYRNVQALKAVGKKYLDDNSIKLKEKISLSAIDLRYAQVNIEYLTFMDKVSVRSLIHGVVETYPISEMQITLNQPTASKLTLGAETVTITDRLSNNVKDRDNQFSFISQRIYNLENPESPASPENSVSSEPMENS